jgi:hypothetical protein
MAHGLWLTLLAFLLVEADYMKGDEAWLVKNTSAVLRLLLPESDKPDPKEFAFINVAWDKQLVDRLDADGFPSGNRAVVDRAKLAQLLTLLADTPTHKFLMCDVVFLDPTPSDSAFNAAIQRLPRAVYSAVPNDSGQVTEGVFDLPHAGIVEYREVDNDFLKFRLVRDGRPSLPVTMFEQLDGGTFEHGPWASWRNGRLAENDFILDLRLRQHDLMQPDRAYAYADLHTLTDLIDIGQGGQVTEFVKDRIVVIGDFEDRDIHMTMFGETAGPLILLNIYLALHEGDNILPVGFFIFLWVVFFFTSIGLFTKDDLLESLVLRVVGKGSLVWKLVLQGAVYTILFGLVSVVSFLLFKIHINFLMLSFYYQIWEWGKLIVEHRRNKRQPAAISTSED